MTIINNRCIVFFNGLDKLFLRAAVTREAHSSVAAGAHISTPASFEDLLRYCKEKHLAKLGAKLKDSSLRHFRLSFDDSKKEVAQLGRAVSLRRANLG